MEIFRVTGFLPVTGEFPSQRPVKRSNDIFVDLHLNTWLSKRLWDWWVETPSLSLWRHCNGSVINISVNISKETAILAWNNFNWSRSRQIDLPTVLRRSVFLWDIMWIINYSYSHNDRRANNSRSLSLIKFISFTLLKLGYGWVITSHRKLWCYLHIHAIISFHLYCEKDPGQ